MSEIKHVRLWAHSNTVYGTAWNNIGAAPRSEAWKELSEGKEEAFKGNTNGSAGSELLPSEATGIVASTLTSMTASFHVPNYALAVNEKLLGFRVVARMKQVTSLSAKLNSAGASAEGHSVVESQCELLVPGTTPAFWAEAALNEAGLAEYNAHPPLLNACLAGGAAQVIMAKAKEVKVFGLYVDLEIEVTGEAGLLRGSSSVKVGGTARVAATGALSPAAIVKNTGVSALTVLASLRAPATSAVPAAAKLSAGVSLGGPTSVVISGTVRVTATTGTTAELRASTVVKALGLGRLVVASRLAPAPVIVRVGSAGSLAAVASARGVASVVVVTHATLRVTASIGARGAAVVAGTSRLTPKAALAASATVKVTGSSRITTTGIARRGIVLYAVVTDPARIPSFIKPPAEIPATIASPETVHSRSEIE